MAGSYRVVPLEIYILVSPPTYLVSLTAAYMYIYGPIRPV